MNVRFWITQSNKGRFIKQCEAVIRNVDSGTKQATTAACLEILSESLSQVPIDTGTLASTAFYEVNRRADIKGYKYEGTIGYAGVTKFGPIAKSGRRMRSSSRGFGELDRDEGVISAFRPTTYIGALYAPVGARSGMRDSAATDAINPKTGIPASYYAARVHEDLSMPHTHGKAKFLEDPVRAYGARYKRVAEQYWRWAILESDVLIPGRGNKADRMSKRTTYAKVQITGDQASGDRGISGTMVGLGRTDE